MNKNKAEAEVKFKLLKKEFNDLPEILHKKGYKLKSRESLVDYFVKREKSKHKGWDFTRIRVVDGDKFILTEKKWVLDNNNNPVRLEDEKFISDNDFKKIGSKNKKMLSVSKERINFRGEISNNKATVSMDNLKINNKNYYFLEAEVITVPSKSAEIRDSIKRWVIKELRVKNTKEAPSILDFVLNLKK